MDAGVNGDQRPPVVPLSTYRLQFSNRFRFTDAKAIVPYLAELGIGAIYASPYLRARPGSEHGYDVIDHNALNPEIGTQEQHRELIACAQQHGIGHLLDFVPNHMGIRGIENRWWADLLEWGERSSYAKFFDVDWHPRRTDLDGRVLLPFLGDHYGRVLERGELTPAYDSARRMLVVKYFDLAFPISPPSYATVLERAAQLTEGPRTRLMQLAHGFAALAGSAKDPGTQADALKEQLASLVESDPGTAASLQRALDEFASRSKLHALLEQQHYRLASWRVSLHEINYRRFFNINELAGLRIEDAEVLAQTHRLLFEMIADGRLQGLRVDHVDGLFNPGAYCRLLRERAALLHQPIYLLVEKILARFERLPPGWEVDGTTGYDFMNAVNELFVNPRSEAAFDRLYGQFVSVEEAFDDVAYASKRYIIANVLSSELTWLATALSRIALSDMRSSDFTYDGLRDAVAAVVASFPVYRTYVADWIPNDEDRRFVEWAVLQAEKRSPLVDESIFTFLSDVLTERILELPDAGYDPSDVLHFIMRFQQYTGPVMAKAIEDTAFYRYVRLISLNEVGGDPRRFGSSTAAFHRQNGMRAADFPHAMLATATHDHKRGEDTRLRIDALSEMPGRWRRMLRFLNRLAKPSAIVDTLPAPSKRDQYAIYQMLVGTWPMEWLEVEVPPQAEIDAYLERFSQWIRKSMREAKLNSSWARPNPAYEDAALEFVRRLFEGSASRILLREVRLLVRDVAYVAMISGLAQVSLKLTSPGVPDTYQGCELWDLSMVDPDNRRPVDFERRMRLLSEIKARWNEEQPPELLGDLLRSWSDGRIKMFVTWRLLQLRKEFPSTFLGGAYRRLAAGGQRAASLVAYARDRIVVIAPRLVYPILQRSADGLPIFAFRNEHVTLPENFPRHFRNVFTGAVVQIESSGRPRLSAQTVFEDFPVAVLVPI